MTALEYARTRRWEVSPLDAEAERCQPVRVRFHLRNARLYSNWAS